MKTLILLAFLLAQPRPPVQAEYGHRVTFAKQLTLVFPDCQLVYLGERKVSSPVFKPGIIFYDFEARVGNQTKVVSWSSGTGIIAPADFEVGGRKFTLELRASEAFKGWLKQDELILWKGRPRRK